MYSSKTLWFSAGATGLGAAATGCERGREGSASAYADDRATSGGLMPGVALDKGWLASGIKWGRLLLVVLRAPRHYMHVRLLNCIKRMIG